MTAEIGIKVEGIDELRERLTFLGDRDARSIGRAAENAMAREMAKSIRRFIPKSIMPQAADKGIGSRLIRMRGGIDPGAKAGVAVGPSGKRVNAVINRGGRKGVGVSANNLHWFALGTADRYTGSRKSGNRSKPTGNPRHFTGRIDKTKWGEFVQRGALAAELTAVAAAQKAVASKIAKLTEE